MLDSSGGVFTRAPAPLKIFHDRWLSSMKSEHQLFCLLCISTLNGLEAKSAVFDIKITDSLPGCDITYAREFVNALKEYIEGWEQRPLFF